MEWRLKLPSPVEKKKENQRLCFYAVLQGSQKSYVTSFQNLN